MKEGVIERERETKIERKREKEMNERWLVDPCTQVSKSKLVFFGRL
jgi:hypothetical protein